MRTTTKVTALFLGVAASSAIGTTLVLAQASAGETQPVTVQTSSAPSATKPAVKPSATQTSASSTPTEETSSAVLSLGAKGDQVRELQKYLWRLGLLSVAPTGNFGPMTQQAVVDFQNREGLEATGEVNDELWNLIKAKGEKLPDPVKPSETAKPTSQPTQTSQPTETTRKANPHNLDERCLTGRVLCISKQTRRIHWVIDGVVQDDFSVRLGREGMRTREGVFSVYLKSEHHWSTLYNVRMPYAMFFSGGQAVHYSADFAANGYGVGSHGCVNMRDKAGSKWLFSQVKVGDKVVVYS